MLCFDPGTPRYPQAIIQTRDCSNFSINCHRDLSLGCARTMPSSNPYSIQLHVFALWHPNASSLQTKCSG